MLIGNPIEMTAGVVRVYKRKSNKRDRRTGACM